MFQAIASHKSISTNQGIFIPDYFHDQKGVTIAVWVEVEEMDHVIIKFGNTSRLEKFTKSSLSMSPVDQSLIKRHEPQSTLKKKIEAYEAKAEYISHTESPD